ncbi:hypothetical protein ACOMHN_031630 [Nucella lapillus]
MGKAADQKLQIRLKNSQRNYHPGDVLMGFVLLNVEDSRQSTSLDLKLCGKAIVAFNRDSPGSDRKQLYASNEYYLEKHLRLWPQGNAGSSTSQPLSAGHHEFPFSLTLPADIPSSFQSVSGNLMYYLKAKLEEGKHSTSAKEFFIVVRPLDLNSIPHARCGVDGEGEKTLCCLCCASGPVSARVFLPKTGFVPGETIPLHATICNNSGRRMTKSYFIVEQVSECYAMGKTDKVSKDFKPSTPLPEHPAILDGRTDEWTGVETLTVPTVVPTGLEGCGIIDVKHALVVRGFAEMG